MKDIINFLLDNLPRARLVSNNTEINCRCMYCPDSKNLDHAHFYISVPKDYEPILFHCKKCDSRGFITHKTLMEWNLIDTNISTKLIKYNKISSIRYSGIYNLSNDIANINNTFISDCRKSEIKLNHINKRLGTNFNYTDLINSKIVLNLKDLLNSNNIDRYTRHPNIINQLDEFFIGFLSYDNSFINFRKIVDKGIVYHTIDKRYINYNIFNKIDNTSNYFTIPSSIDLFKPIKIHVAEGPFDTLSIRYNLRKDESDNAIFTTVHGNNYLGAIRFFLLVISVPNVEVHVYLDEDVSKKTIPHLQYNLRLYNIPVYVHWNLISKDMGVTIDNIEESIIQIL